MSYKKRDLDEMTNEGQPGYAPARAKQILWSPWGQLPPRGGGGLPEGGDDEDERVNMKIKVIIKFINKNKLPRGVGSGSLHYKKGSCAHWSKACL
jgi:hypothetical protein